MDAATGPSRPAARWRSRTGAVAVVATAALLAWSAQPGTRTAVAAESTAAARPVVSGPVRSAIPFSL